jgi:transposase-like protein
LRGMLELPDGGQISDEVIDQLLAGARTEAEIAGPGGVLAQLTKRLIERALEVELTEHLGYEPHCEPAGGAGNTRNGTTPKTVITDQGRIPIDTPRDRNGAFEPQLVRKRQRRFKGFDDKILALYSRGLSTRDIEAHLAEIYGVKVGRDLISRVTDAVMEDVRAWQQRPLDDVYPVIFLDALVLKIREGGSVQRRACYLALGISVDGDRDVLGCWSVAKPERPGITRSSVIRSGRSSRTHTGASNPSWASPTTSCPAPVRISRNRVRHRRLSSTIKMRATAMPSPPGPPARGVRS